MNRSLDGVLLGVDDLARIALGAGIIDEHALGNLGADVHNTNLLASRLAEMTANVRFAMWSRGELLLDTRTDANTGAS